MVKLTSLNKLADQSGETLAETLVSILIASLSTVMLATAIAAATRIVLKTRETTANYFTSTAELVEGSGPVGGVTVTENLFGPTNEDVSPKAQFVFRERELPGGKTGVSYEVKEG